MENVAEKGSRTDCLFNPTVHGFAMQAICSADIALGPKRSCKDNEVGPAVCSACPDFWCEFYRVSNLHSPGQAGREYLLGAKQGNDL